MQSHINVGGGLSMDTPFLKISPKRLKQKKIKSPIPYTFTSIFFQKTGDLKKNRPSKTFEIQISN